MTKRDFDKATKQNWGSKCMARDERCTYRTSRGMQHNGSNAHGATTTRDFLAYRAAEMAYRNETLAIYRDGFLPTLALGSKFRSVANFRLVSGKPLLEG